MINDQDNKEHVPAYVLGALDPGEVAAFEARLTQDDDLRAEVQSYRQVVADLPLAVVPVRPPDALKVRLMAQVAPRPALSPAPPVARTDQPRRRWQTFAAAAAIVLLLVVGGALATVYGQLQAATATNIQLVAQLADSERALADLRRLQQETSASLDAARQRAAALEADLNTDRTALAQLQREIAASEQLVRFLSEGDLTARDLSATGTSVAARGAMYMRPGQRDAVVLVSGLPPLAPGEHYQLWLANNDTPTPFNAGSMTTAGNGSAQIVLQAPVAVNAFAEAMITLEYERNAPLPSTAPVLRGTL